MVRICGHNLKSRGTHMATNCLHTCMSQMLFPANAFKDFIHYSINLTFRTLSFKSGPDMDQGPVVQFLKYSVTHLCPTLCDLMGCSRAVFSVHHQLWGIAQTQDPLSCLWHPTISSSHVPSSSFLQTFPHQGIFQWVSSLHQVAKVLELQIQHQSFAWRCRTDLL